MSLYPELSVVDQDIEVVKGIQFTLMSPDEIRTRSVAEITSTDTCNGSEPVIGGLFDPRMGVIEHNKKCCTCDQKNTFCPGHFGHINLAAPVFYIQFFDTVRKLMTCVCYRCSKLLESDLDSGRKAQRQKRFEQVYKATNKATKRKVCANCDTIQPAKIVKDNSGFLALSFNKEKGAGADDVAADAAGAAAAGGDDNKINLYAADVLPILSRISDADAEILGFNKALNRPDAPKFGDLELRRILGVGTFGRVKLVVHKKTGETYALKCMRKAQVVAMRQQAHVLLQTKTV
jgi:DNA-directed RNA polymerase II subunit RPB1